MFKSSSNLFSLINNSGFFSLFQTKNTFSSVSSPPMIRLWQPLFNATSNKFCVTMFSSLCHVQQQTYIKCLFWNNTTHYLCMWNVINKNSKNWRSGIFVCICERLYDMACVGQWMNKCMCQVLSSMNSNPGLIFHISTPVLVC